MAQGGTAAAEAEDCLGAQLFGEAAGSLRILASKMAGAKTSAGASVTRRPRERGNEKRSGCEISETA